MKIIDELAYSSIKVNQKDTVATKITIFLAVLFLGAIIFDISFMKEDFYRETVSRIGDYHISLAEINEQSYELLKANNDIEHISFDKLVETELNAIIYEKGDYYWNLAGEEAVRGKKPSAQDELMVTERFLNKNKDLSIGSKIKAQDKSYTIVGTYDDHGYTFDRSMLIGYLAEDEKERLFENNAGIVAYIWFKNPRDTYPLTKEILKDMDIDDKIAENTGRLYFNKDVLEYKMIYPSGIIPPSNVISDMAENYGALLVLSLLFVVMIYGAFNVWNNRDIKEIALLKSAGMTEKQVKKMIRLKAIRLGLIPIISGTVLSYFTANLLLYLIWLNNAISYRKMSDIWGEKLQAPDFKLIPITFQSILLILFFSFMTVYLSAALPARQSARLKVVEGLNGILEKKIRFGKSKISGKIENSLANDYFRSYQSTYRTIIIAMLISAAVMNLVVVSQSYRTLIGNYDRYQNPYNITSNIFMGRELDKQLTDELEKVEGIDELHVYEKQDFKFFISDNQGFLSNELQEALNSGYKNEESLYVRIYALSDADYNDVLKENGYESEISYIMLNKIPADNRTPYAFRRYIPISGKGSKILNLKYNAKGNVMAIPVDGYIDKMPYDLSGYDKNALSIFTRNSTLERFIEENGKDQGDPTYYYTIKIKASSDLGNVADKCEKIISSYIPRSDYSTMTDILKVSLNQEQTRNENILATGIQMVLLIIALTNMYTGFHGNLRARKREFHLLSTIGMTEKQMKNMIFLESRILFVRAVTAYIGVFFLVIAARAYRSNFEFGFAVKEILKNLNYVPLIIIFIIMGTGIAIAIRSGIKSILKEDLSYSVRGL